MDSNLLEYHLTHRQQDYQCTAYKARLAKSIRQQRVRKKAKPHSLRFYWRYLGRLLSRLMTVLNRL
ncbi:MAG: hypothetical protein AAFR81_10550 [Chloroflexota bacterium]